jgi:hypothetical protein
VEMAYQTETFDLNEHMHDVSDFGDAHLKFGNLPKDSRPQVGSISTPNGPSTSKSMVTPIDLDVKAKITWEVLKTQFILNLKSGSFITSYFSPGIFLW